MAERYEKAPSQRLRYQPVHVVGTSANGALHKLCSSATDRGKKLEQQSSNQNKARQVKSKKIPYIAEGVAHQHSNARPAGPHQPSVGLQHGRSKQELRPAERPHAHYCSAASNCGYVSVGPEADSRTDNNTTDTEARKKPTVFCRLSKKT